MKFDPSRISVELVQALPEATRLELVRDAAKLQCVELLCTLQEAGTFALPSPQDVRAGVTGPWNAELSAEFPVYPAVAGVATVMSKAVKTTPQDYVDDHSATPPQPRPFMRLPASDEFKNWFTGFATEFAARHRLFENDMETDGEVGKHLERMRVTARNLMTCAVALGSSEALQALCSAYGLPDHPTSGSPTRVLTEQMLGSDGYAFHPVRAAVEYEQLHCIDVLVAHGYSLENILVKGNSCTLQTLRPSTEAADKILSCIDVQKISALDFNHPQCTALRGWAESAINSGDEGMIEVAKRRGVVAAFADNLFFNAIDALCISAASASVAYIDWDKNFERYFDHLLRLKQWAPNWDPEAAAGFTAEVFQALVDHGHGRQLCRAIDTDEGSSHVVSQMALLGAKDAVLCCLEQGAGADRNPDLTRLARRCEAEWNRPDIATLIRSCQAQRAAQASLQAVQAADPAMPRAR